MPTPTVCGGPNGSGKSPVTRSFNFEGKHNLLDRDAIAKRINPFNPTQGAVDAGREVLSRTQAYLTAREVFLVETTLSGKWILPVMRSAVEHGFCIRLFYVCLNTPARKIQRASDRVSKGGHDVPDEEHLTALRTQSGKREICNGNSASNQPLRQFA